MSSEESSKKSIGAKKKTEDPPATSSNETPPVLRSLHSQWLSTRREASESAHPLSVPGELPVFSRDFLNATANSGVDASHRAASKESSTRQHSTTRPEHSTRMFSES